MGIISLALQMSFMPLEIEGCDILEFAPISVIAAPGLGAPVREGDLITVDYRVEDASGKEIANSERRGLASTFVQGTPLADALLSASSREAREGEERWVVLLKEDWYSISPYGLTSSSGPVLVWLRVLKITRR